MKKAFIRLYEELNDYLPPARRKREFEISLSGKDTVREIIEKLGVPAAQVDLLLVDGRSSDLDQAVHEEERISVYPVFERFDIQGLSRVREKPLRKLQFIVDKDLKALGRSLERLGMDVHIGDELEREETLRLSDEEHRIVLTLRGDLPESHGLDRVVVLKPGSL
ncbi:MAG: Mut7-C RNAse domain-containing protein, partial [Deltaproteobacteria bacterium]